jgi:23S rRNA (cytidine1920-2'-O)/16S rRNA (cytidine1409-2'-O)-methyltransferase
MPKAASVLAVGSRRRLDAELVRRGLVPSRERAQAEIAAGRVLVGGAPTLKPSRLVDSAEAVLILGPPPRFVSRAGAKLEGAIDRFALHGEFDGARVLDVGASTGGFTDCALQHGAREVIALDVGHNQLHERIRSDTRVRVLERTNIRSTERDQIGGPVEILVAELSFISLRVVLDPMLALCHDGALLVLLVKPQFEAGRIEAARGRGIITDPAIWRRVLEEVTSALVATGAAIIGVMVSPITGSDGNVEFVLVGRAADDPRRPGLEAEALSQAIEEAIGLAPRSGAFVSTGLGPTDPGDGGI